MTQVHAEQLAIPMPASVPPKPATCLLSASPAQIAQMTPEERTARVELLLLESWALLRDGIERMVIADGRKVAAICVLFSGGNDSTTLAHIFKEVADYFIHVNTGIGIEQTRQYVRDTAKAWDVPLIEKHPPPGSTYEELILDQGFPGPAMHWKMYQRLKERALREARRDLIKNPRRERVVFLGGRRRDESQRRANIPEMDRDGSIVYISPLVHWTKMDLNTYRHMYPDVPRNMVSDLIHMSGECLCGAFAHAGELEEIAAWFPETAEHIRKLEEKVKATGKFPEKLCRWGWGGQTIKNGETHPAKTKRRAQSGYMCSSCDSRFFGDTTTTVCRV